jgi:putative membrane protein insertion efficiency factor
MSQDTEALVDRDDLLVECDTITPAVGRRHGVARLVVGAVHAYQAARSGRPTGCRYLPSCSEYAVEAIDVHGPARGVVLAARRIARCTPWGGHGIDPVPDRRAP